MSRYPFLVLPLLLHSSMLPQVVRSQINGNARSCSCHQRCPAAAVQQMPTRATSHSDTSNWLSPPQPLLPDRQSHCSAFSSAAVRGDTATARACSSRSGEDGSTGGHHAARRQGQQERLCFARACARLVPVAGRRQAGGPERPGRVGRDLSDGKRSCDSAAVSALCCNVHRRHLAPSQPSARSARRHDAVCRVHDRRGAQAGRRAGAARAGGS